VHEERQFREASYDLARSNDAPLFVPHEEAKPTAKRVLLTGATGFLGGAFLAQSRPTDGPAVEWVLIARGNDAADARRRIWARLTRFVDETTASRILSDAQVLCSDLRDPTAMSEEALAGVTHVVHLAANTSFMSSRGVWETNYEATRSLAKRIRGISGLQRFLYVGTAMICGDAAQGVVHEDDFPAAGVRYPVAYTASKAAAEQMLRVEFPDLPLVVARPSIVVGHTELGCGPSGSIFWVMRALERVRLLSGGPDASLDVIPVDYAAKALDHLAFAQTLSHRTYHISAGLESRTPIRKAASRLAAARAQALPFGDFTVIQSKDLRQFKRRFVDAFGPANGRRMLLALGLYLRFCELNVRFDNRRLRSEGVPAAPSLLDYLESCLRQCENIDIVAQADDEL
jgi:nucleoside-diphosphate-sugar epimerase